MHSRWGEWWAESWDASYSEPGAWAGGWDQTYHDAGWAEHAAYEAGHKDKATNDEANAKATNDEAKAKATNDEAKAKATNDEAKDKATNDEAKDADYNATDDGANETLGYEAGWDEGHYREEPDEAYDDAHDEANEGDDWWWWGEECQGWTEDCNRNAIDRPAPRGTIQNVEKTFFGRFGETLKRR